MKAFEYPLDSYPLGLKAGRDACFFFKISSFLLINML